MINKEKFYEGLKLIQSNDISSVVFAEYFEEFQNIELKGIDFFNQNGLNQLSHEPTDVEICKVIMNLLKQDENLNEQQLIKGIVVHFKAYVNFAHVKHIVKEFIK